MLHVQALESRQLMSVSVIGPVLQIIGTPGDDVYDISSVPGGIKISENGVVRTFPSVGISRVAALLGDGSDTFNTLPTFVIRMTVDGGPGDDQIYTGNNSDRITGGPGWDVVRGSGGADQIFGGTGDYRYDSPTDRSRESLWGDGGDDYIEAAGYGPVDFGHVSLSGGAGNDTLVGHVGRGSFDGGLGDDRITGGPGNEGLHGGDGNDTIYGRGGDDEIFGGNGDDLLDGGAYGTFVADNTGNDILHGDAGNDTLIAPDFGTGKLYGDAGHDNLFGSNGDDDLYGGPGIDYLYGGRGDDGLLGGPDRDFLTGDAGDDRFVDRSWLTRVGKIVTRHWEDSIADKTSTDARIGFQNGVSVTVVLGSGLGLQTYSGAEWSQAEIEKLDGGFRTMQDATHNTKLLKLPSGGDQIMIRQGTRSDVLEGGDYANGWNDGGVITLTGYIAWSSPSAALKTMFHEVGHSWQETPGWNELSGWTMADRSSDPAYTSFVGSSWWWLRTAEFASRYAMTNPGEDFAESFAANMLDRADLLSRSSGVSIVAVKQKFIEGMLARMA